jgi:hypothetical protein
VPRRSLTIEQVVALLAETPRIADVTLSQLRSISIQTTEYVRRSAPCQRRIVRTQRPQRESKWQAGTAAVNRGLRMV